MTKLIDIAVPPDMNKVVSIKKARVIYMDPEEAERQERLAREKQKVIYKIDLHPDDPEAA
jgi:glutamyl-tRNA reductase